MPQSIQHQLLQNWNPITPIFQGASINNCTFKINFGPNPVSPCHKRRRVIIEEDSQWASLRLACYISTVNKILSVWILLVFTNLCYLEWSREYLFDCLHFYSICFSSSILYSKCCWIGFYVRLILYPIPSYLKVLQSVNPGNNWAIILVIILGNTCEYWTASSTLMLVNILWYCLINSYYRVKKL